MDKAEWRDKVEWLRLYSRLKGELMQALSAQDLAFKLPGSNPTLGEQCLAMGEVQQSYINSFRNFQQDFEYRQPDRSMATSLKKLVSWYAELDEDLFNLLENLPLETIEARTIDRGDDFQVDCKTQLDIYREALVIFYGKVSIYLKAMGMELPGRWGHWIE